MRPHYPCMPVFYSFIFWLLMTWCSFASRVSVSLSFFVLECHGLLYFWVPIPGDLAFFVFVLISLFPCISEAFMSPCFFVSENFCGHPPPHNHYSTIIFFPGNLIVNNIHMMICID